MKTLREAAYIIIIIALTLISLKQRPCGTAKTETRYDTVFVKDTIRDTVLSVCVSQIVRTDTVWLRAAGDTTLVEVEVPVERRTYETKDYRAVVEGFNPRLAEMEVYRNTVYVNKTETVLPRRPSRWGIGIQAGYGYTLSGPTPYIGVGIQYNIIHF